MPFAVVWVKTKSDAVSNAEAIPNSRKVGLSPTPQKKKNKIKECDTCRHVQLLDVEVNRYCVGGLTVMQVVKSKLCGKLELHRAPKSSQA